MYAGEIEMRIVKTIAQVIFILCLPALLLSASLAWGFNSQWLLNYGFNKYNVSQVTGLPDEELEKVAVSWTDYINSGEEYWSITVSNGSEDFELFTQEEQIHFKDVKQLIWLDYRVLLATLLFILAYVIISLSRGGKNYLRSLARSVIQGSGLSLLLIIIAGVAVAVDFESLFLQFHFLAFSNEHWSAQGYMLLLFPGGFWFDAALICTAFMAGLAVLLGALSAAYLKYTVSHNVFS